MSKSQLTRVELEEALKRLIVGQTLRIDPLRRISVKAIEEEANLGDGSAYYYKDIIQKIKDAAVKHTKDSCSVRGNDEQLSKLRSRLGNETRLKEKYRKEVGSLKYQLSKMATEHNQFALIIQQYQHKISELEATNLTSVNFNVNSIKKEKSEDLENKILLGEKKDL